MDLSIGFSVWPPFARAHVTLGSTGLVWQGWLKALIWQYSERTPGGAICVTGKALITFGEPRHPMTVCNLPHKNDPDFFMPLRKPRAPGRARKSRPSA